MDIQMAAFVFGCLLLFVAILGGGFEVKELKVPKVGRASRLASCVLGMLFIVIGFSPAFAGVLPGLPDEPKPQTTTPLAQPAADIRPTAEPAQQPRASEPAPRPTTPEPEKPSWRERARTKAKKAWQRVW